MPSGTYRYTSLLYEQDAGARTIMQVLGRSSLRAMMDISTFVRLDEQRDAIRRLGDALSRDDSGAS